MKKVALIFLTIGLIALSSCNQKTDTKTMLENSEIRTEIFDAIVNNHNYMTELMDNMEGNELAMQMMQGNNGMMGKMMHEKGMMGEDCMESCMDMMAEKGIDNIEQAKLELSKSKSHGNHH